jgi:hypothetical protein
MTVSDVGRTNSLQLFAAAVRHDSQLRRNPSTCSFSFSKNDNGIRVGKAALTWPVLLNSASR